MNKRYLSIPFRSITTGTLFKLGLFSNLAIWGLLGVVMGLLGLSGFDIVEWNDEYVYGAAAMVIGVVLAAVFALLGTFLLMLGGLLARWLARWLPFGSLEFAVPGEAAEDNAGTIE